MTPANSNLTPAQRRFLALHSSYLVECWQWIFGGGTLVARAGRTVATVTCAEFAQLIDAGLVEPVGCAGAKLTEQGRAAA